MRRNRNRDYSDDAQPVIEACPETPIVKRHSRGGFITQHRVSRDVRMRRASLLAAFPHSGASPAALRLLRQHPSVFQRILAERSLYPLVVDPWYSAAHFLDEDVAEGPAQLSCKAHGRELLCLLGQACAHAAEETHQAASRLDVRRRKEHALSPTRATPHRGALRN